MDCLGNSRNLRALLLAIDVISQLNDQIRLPFRYTLCNLGELPIVGVATVLETVVERTPPLHATAGVSDYRDSPWIPRNRAKLTTGNFDSVGPVRHKKFTDQNIKIRIRFRTHFHPRRAAIEVGEGAMLTFRNGAHDSVVRWHNLHPHIADL